MLCGDLMPTTMSPTSFFFSIICIYIFNLTFYLTLNNKKTIKINNNKIIK